MCVAFKNGGFDYIIESLSPGSDRLSRPHASKQVNRELGGRPMNNKNNNDVHREISFTKYSEQYSIKINRF